MYNYNRSTKLLTTTVAQLRNYPTLTPDSIAILLMLTASLPKHDLNRIIDHIPQIYPINSKLKTLNNLRQIIGPYARDYLMLHAMQMKDDNVSSDELQQLISNAKIAINSQHHNLLALHDKTNHLFFSYKKTENIW